MTTYRRARSLVETWLLLDFFGESRSAGQPGSSLTSTIFTQSFIALIVAALLFDPTIGAVPFLAANLSLSTLFVGLGSVGDVQRRDRRSADELLVGTAPLSRAVLPLARVLHGGFFTVLVTTGMALPPAILSAWVTDTLWIVPAYVVAASLLSGIAAGAIGVLLDVVERFGGPARVALVAGTLRGVFLAGGLIGFVLCLRVLDGTADDLPFGRDGALAWPPYWGARFLAHPATDLGLGLAVPALGALLFAISIAFGNPHGSTRRTGRVGNGLVARAFARIDRALADRGPLLGATAFVGAMIYRSADLRARVLPLVGVPAAMLGLALWGQAPDERPLLIGVGLQFPAIYLPFLIAFLAFGDQPEARHVFTAAPRVRVELAREASLRALTSRVLLPIYAIAALVLTATATPSIASALAQSVFAFAVAVHVAGVAVRHVPHMPFTAPRDDTAGLELGGLIGIALALAAVGGGFAMIAERPIGWVVAGILALGAWRRLRRGLVETTETPEDHGAIT